MNRIILIAVVTLLLCGCTVVSADLQTGKIDVLTFATSRQDVVIEHLADGTARWSAKQSDPDAELAEALLNLSKVVAKIP